MKLIMTLLMFPMLAFAQQTVEIMRVPDGGIEPQAIARDGVVDVIYFKGDPAHGDVLYVRSEDGEKFSQPIRVNSDPATALAIGAVRGAQLAVGKRGQVHVVWN